MMNTRKRGRKSVHSDSTVKREKTLPKFVAAKELPVSKLDVEIDLFHNLGIAKFDRRPYISQKVRKRNFCFF